MDWHSINFDWNHARAFLVTAEEGSLTAAARALDTTQPTLGRQVSALESALGVILFERVGKGFELTPSGTELLEYVRAMGDAAANLSLAATGQSESINGNITISATDLVAVHVLPQIIIKLTEAHPGIRVKIIASNNDSDLIRREADIAIRGNEVKQLELIAKKICEVRTHLYASIGYIAQHGIPNAPNDLNNANFICDETNVVAELLNQSGFQLNDKNFPIRSESVVTQLELVKRGSGIALLPDQIARNEPSLKILLPNIQPYRGPLWLVVHRELRTNRRVRMVYDFLFQALSAFLK